MSLKELNAEFLLKKPDLSTEGGLSNMQRGCCPSKMAVLSEDSKIAKLPEIHGLEPKFLITG